ncbi:BTB/POZ domain protein [Aspergillus clavatus NRRL 1]|uniref:BTB/POZ domain protein n=1 Tax=Aspergillus clavatus (strain ATCC 1007 / CBS 513.65 / DSM 816 / NCTC 3887 / NRRL 1 / QM 1276 / 107) TaxID=344612 RepID=A1CSP6_ASPCL|nr:BTB/POZ domain protein [Aspergillus clavatus NRRL 1]EAW06333.1 BTB/POZ domain protein [Aspergillus clavatus NRRL 1]
MDSDQLIESQAEPGSLTAGIQEFVFFRSSIFSDLKIISKDQEFKVHRLIICGQSAYFARLFNHNWKEVEESVVRLEDDDPRAVEAMINFLYGFDYNSIGRDRERVSPMLFHAKVYQVGDKYDVPKLKEQARTEFAAAIQTDWDMDDFPLAIAGAYSTTPSGDRGLRDPLVDTSLGNISALLEKEGFIQVLRETVGFAADLVQKQNNPSRMKRYRCLICCKEWEMLKSEFANRCPFCGKRRDWEEFIVL